MKQTIEHPGRHGRASAPAEPDARHWLAALAPYRESSLGRSLAELFVTVVPFVALWLATLLSLRYRLGEALRAHPELRAVCQSLTLKESFRCLRLALWDEDQRRLVAFRETRSAVC